MTRSISTSTAIAADRCQPGSMGAALGACCGHGVDDATKVVLPVNLCRGTLDPYSRSDYQKLEDQSMLSESVMDYLPQVHDLSAPSRDVHPSSTGRASTRARRRRGTKMSGHVSRGGASVRARRLVVVALILAGFAASFATSAAAAPFPRESNAVFEPVRWTDHARDLTNHWVDRGAVRLRTGARYVQPYLVPPDDLYLLSDGAVAVNRSLWTACYRYGCCSPKWYWSMYPGWFFQVCAYDGRGWFYWRRQP